MGHCGGKVYAGWGETIMDGILAGQSYVYRIKQYDIDGAFAYSPKVEVAINQAGVQLAVGPNPFEDEIQIRLVQNLEGRGKVTLYSLFGQRKWSLFTGDIQGNELTVTTSDIPPGIYMLQFEFEGEQQWARKMMKR